MRNSKLSLRGLKRPLLLARLLLLTLPVVACTTTTSTVAIDTSCQSFEPITWSQSDTSQTITEVKAHNAAWDALCGE